MVTKKSSESERMKPGSRDYLAIEGACRGAFASHPKGMAQPPHRFVEALDRWDRTALHASPRAASDRSHVPALAGNRFGP